MVFNPNLNLSLTFNNTPIEQVNSFKLLGFEMDDQLRFDNHVNSVTNKLNKSLAFLHKLHANKMPKFIKDLIYFAFVESHIIYSCLLLNNLKKSNLTKVERIFNKCIKFLYTKKHMENNLLLKIIYKHCNNFILSNLMSRQNNFVSNTLKNQLGRTCRRKLFILPKRPKRRLSFFYQLLCNFNDQNKLFRET